LFLPEKYSILSSAGGAWQTRASSQHFIAKTQKINKNTKIHVLGNGS
jgi:predicted metalloprotease